MRHLLLASIFVFASAPVAHAWEPSETPIVAPKGCVEPVGNGPSAMMTRGPKLVGRYQLANGKSLDTPRLRLRLRAYGEFIPERLGSKRGEVQARFEAQLLPDVVRDGENPENSVFTAAPGVLRLLNYRISLRTVSTAPLAYDAVVEDVGCTEEGTLPPLAAKQSSTFWVSTDAVLELSFSTVPWYMSGDRLQVTLMPDLDPPVQQKDKANPTGYVKLHVFEGRDGSPKSIEWNNDDIAGKTATLLDYKVEVIKVLWGKDTRLVDGRPVTKGNEPAVSVLVRVTRLQVTPRGY